MIHSVEERASGINTKGSVSIDAGIAYPPPPSSAPPPSPLLLVSAAPGPEERKQPSLVDPPRPAGASGNSGEEPGGTPRSGKGKEPEEQPRDGNPGNDEEGETTGWMGYPPPPTLSNCPEGLPEIVYEIVRVSIENVAARAAQAETQRREEDEARQQAVNGDEAGGKQKGKEKEIDYFPIVIPEAEEEKKRRIDAELTRRRQAAMSPLGSLDANGCAYSTGSTEIPRPPQQHGPRRHKYSLSRILNRLGGGVRGESSAAGAAGGALRKGGGVSSGGVMDVPLDRDAMIRELRAGAAGYGPYELDAMDDAVSPDDLQERAARLRQLGVVATVLQKSHDSRNSRHSAMGGLRRRRTQGRLQNVMIKAIMDNETNSSGSEPQISSENGNDREIVAGTEARTDQDSVAELEECISCFDEFLPDTMVKAPCHSYCRDCFTRLVANALQNEQQWPPKCCLNEIPFHTIYACIETDLRTTFQSRAREWSTPVEQRVYCHDPECSVWLSADLTDAGRRVATCPQGHATCTICRGAAHDGSDCPEDRELGRTNELAEAEGWKRCARCRALVEHGDACQHMTCRCGHEFCYVCARAWRTCTCTMAQLDALKAEAAARRREREAREAREETELQEALRQIESLELEEALAAVERGMERERREAVRRRGEIAARFAEDDRRRTEVAARFVAYRDALSELHGRQRATLRRDVDEARAALGREKTAELRRMLEAEQAELADLGSAGRRRIRELELALASEFAARTEVERAAEEEYRSRLEVFWSGMKGESAEVAKAISDFRAGLDAPRAEWMKWRDAEAERARFAAAEELGIREEVLAARRTRKGEEYGRRDEQEVRKGRAAQGWFAAVVGERERLLGERERRDLDDTISFEEYDPVEVAIVREMLDNGEDV